MTESTANCPPVDPVGRSVPRWITDIAIAAVLILVTLWLRGPLLRWDLNLSDEGYHVYGVQRITEGQVLYRDFKRNYPPGVYYAFAPLFAVFGHNVLVIRAVWLACLCALVAMTYLIARPLVARWAALWAALVPVFIQPPTHKMIVPLAAMAGLVLCRWIAAAPQRSGRVLFAGMGFGVLGMFRQDMAVFAFVIATLSIAVTVVSGERKSDRRGILKTVRRLIGFWLLLAAGSALVWIVPLLAFLRAGALVEMARQLVLDSLGGNVGMDLPFPSLAQALRAGIPASERMETALFYFPATAVALGTVRLLVGLFKNPARAGYLVPGQWLLMALLSHSSIIYRSDLPHLKQILPLPALAFAFAVAAVRAKAHSRGGEARTRASGIGSGPGGAGAASTSRLRPVVVLFGLAWALAVVGWGADNDLKRARRGMSSGRRLEEPRAGVFVPKSVYESYSGIVGAIRDRTDSGEPIFVAPYMPMLYFLTGRPNPTRYDAVIPGAFATSQVQREIIADLEEAGVRCIFSRDFTFDKMEERRFTAYAAEIEAYLEENFVEVGREKKWIVLVRKKAGADDAADTGQE